MKRLLAILFAAAIALPVAADTQVVCTITAQSNTACSAITVSEASRLAPCQCSPNGDGGSEPSVYDDAIALWKLDEASGTRADSIGSNDLTDNNTVGYVNMGPSGTVAQFIKANNESLTGTFTGSATFTAAIWLNTSETVDDRDIFGIGTTWPNSVNFHLRTENSGTLLVGLVGSGAASVQTSSNTWSGGAVKDSGWRLYFLTFDTDQKIRLYRDGPNIGSNSPSAALGASAFTTASTVFLGGGLLGSLSQKTSRAGYWSRVLSAGEMTTLYNAGIGKSYADLTAAEKVGLVSYWNLDEASGSRADSHGSNTLTDNNTVGSATNSYPANLPGRVANFVATNSEYLSLSSGVADLDDQFTLAGWVYQGAYVAEAGVFNNGPDADFGVRVTMNVVGNGDILVRLPTDATNSANIYGYTASGLVPTGQWVHVVITYDGTDATAANRLHVYTDGVDRSLTKNGTNPSAVRVGGSFAIGQGGATNFVTGRYSVFAVWDYTKDADGVAALYNSGAGAPLP